MYRRTATVVVALTATASLLAGCGGGSSGGKTNTGNVTGSSAAAELSAAISALGQSKTVSATLKLDATASQVLSYVHQQDKKASLTPQQAKAISGAVVSFEVAAPNGKTLNEISGVTNAGAVNVSVTDNGTTFFAIRVVNQTAYLQVDLKDLLTALNQQQTYRQIAGAGAQLPSFLGAAVQGNWISLSLAALKHAVPGAASATANPQQANHFIDEIKSLLTTDVTVTKTSSGGTDTLTLTAHLRTLVSDFSKTFGSSVPGVGSALSSAKLSKVPNKDASLTATVTGGVLTGLNFDLGQFAKSGKGTLPIQLTLAQSGPAITAPAGAVPVDTSQLGSLLSAFGGGR